MVVKIHKSRGSMNGTLTYNESKVRKGVATVIGFGGMPSPEPVFARMTFGRLERRNIRTENVSFQMSINPNPEEPSEALADEEACDYAKDIMKSLGYGSQPYIIYKHFDIDRTHYHVVSCRVDLHGKKINDKFEKKRMEKLILRLADKYHYTVGNPKKKTQKEKIVEEQPLLYNNITEIEPIPLGMEPVPVERIQEDVLFDMSEISPIGTIPSITESGPQEKPETVAPSIRFDPKGKNVKEQYLQVLEEAMTYQFTTLNQFKAVCESLGVTVSTYNGATGVRLSFQGIDENGNIIKTPFNEKELGKDFYKEVETRLQQNSTKEQIAAIKSSSKPDRARVGRMAAFALKISKSQRHFEKILEKKGIYVGFSFNVMNELFGITLVDAKTKNAFKASDLLPSLDMKEVKEKAEKWMTEKEIRANRQKLRDQASRDEFLKTLDRTVTTEEQKLAHVSWIDILNDILKSGRTNKKRTIYKKKY